MTGCLHTINHELDLETKCKDSYLYNWLNV